VFGEKESEKEGDVDGEVSDSYTAEMQEKMEDDSLVYRHDKGMNYAYLTDDVIIGSCLQTPSDVDKLVEKEGVTTILCLQEDVNLDYFSVDIAAIQRQCEQRGDVRHVRCPVRDFDPMDLRRQLPKVVAMICQQHNPEEFEKIYIHCTAGLGRAPAVALAYMFWCREWTLEAANHRLQKVRPCGPKLHAIRQATCDLVFGSMTHPTSISVTADPSAHVQIAGLDLGWGTPQDLNYDPSHQRFELQKQLNPGRYNFKFIIDGTWTCSRDYPISNDGDNENNVLEVAYETKDPVVLSAVHRLLSHDGQLAQNETWRLHAALKKLEPCNEECVMPN